MEKLEQAKADHPSEDALLDDTVASAYCEQFALQTFAKGEKEMAEDRANGYPSPNPPHMGQHMLTARQRDRRHTPCCLHLLRPHVNMEERKRPRNHVQDQVR